jgi:hypothetical protein
MDVSGGSSIHEQGRFQSHWCSCGGDFIEGTVSKSYRRYPVRWQSSSQQSIRFKQCVRTESDQLVLVRAAYRTGLRIPRVLSTWTEDAAVQGHDHSTEQPMIQCT